MDITIETTTTSVTVFPDQARVTVEGQAEMPVGIHRLLVDELPNSLLSESIRISGRGEAKVHILGVDDKRIHYEEVPTKTIQSVVDQIEEIEDKIKEVSDQSSTVAAQLEYLDGLRSETKQYAKALSRGKIDVEYQKTLTQFFQGQDLQLRSEARELSKNEKVLDRRLTKLREDLQQRNSAMLTSRKQILVDVEVDLAGSFNLEASYVVRNASWKPLYDIRLTTSGEKPSLEITSLAQVVQESGQDWTDIALTISTARPAVNQRKPILNPWYIGPPEAYPVRSRELAAAAAVPAQASDADVVSARPEKITAEPMQARKARRAVAEARVTDLAVIYDVSRRADIPSDGSPRKVTLAMTRLEPELDYLTIPKHTNAVYRRIKAVNKSSGPLLSGTASLFSGEDYVGNTELEFVPTDDEFEILLGVEDSVVVKRELVQRDVDKARLRDRRQLAFGHRIELTNLLQTEINVELQDHIPTSRHEDIKVRMLEAQPEPNEQTELNLLTWELTIQPGQEQVIQYVFRVDHPRDMHVVGLGRT